MIRDRFFCPNCQLEEVPVLVVRPWYNCPDCHTISPRKDMLTKRTAKLVLAGSNAINTVSPVFLASGSLFDGSQLTTQLTTSAFASTTNARYAICIASVSNTAVPTSVAFTSGNATSAVSVTDGVLFSSIWYTNSGDITAGQAADTVVVTWGAFAPLSASVTVTRLDKSATASVLDRTKTGFGIGTSIASGNSSVLVANNELAIACICSLESTSDPVVGWLNSFSAFRRTGTDGNPGSDNVLSQGHLSPAGGIVNAKGTIAAGPEWVVSVATFKTA